jgi:hypothetical protein
MNLSSHLNLEPILAYASGTSSRTGTVIDMSGWDGALFIVVNATIAGSAVGDMHLVAGTTSSLTDSTDDVEGSAVAIIAGESDTIKVIDYYKPVYRYATAVITKDASHAQAESVIAIQYNGSKLPVAEMGSDELLKLISPATGTK